MFKFFIRNASDTVLAGAKNYCSSNPGLKMQVRRFTAYALTTVMRMSGDHWTTPEHPLRSVLQEIQDFMPSEGMRLLAENFATKADAGKKAGAKYVMYGFGTVGNWLMNAALMRESGKGSGAEVVHRHREYFTELFDGHETMLTETYLNTLQAEWPQLR